MGWGGWDGMVVKGHRSSKSTFGANNVILYMYARFSLVTLAHSKKHIFYFQRQAGGMGKVKKYHVFGGVRLLNIHQY